MSTSTVCQYLSVVMLVLVSLQAFPQLWEIKKKTQLGEEEKCSRIHGAILKTENATTVDNVIKEQKDTVVG